MASYKKSEKGMVKDILKCPSCSGDGIVMHSFNGTQTLFYVHCGCCGLDGPASYDNQDAIEKWNTIKKNQYKKTKWSERRYMLNKQDKHFENQVTDLNTKHIHARRIRFDSNTTKTLLSFFLVILLITLPTYILYRGSQFYNPLSQILFDVLLFMASVWFAFTISSKEARKNATDKWLPAAETACNELLTISTTTERMRLNQAKTCDSLELVFPDIPEAKLDPVKKFFQSHCGQCRGNLTDLKNHLENSFRNWEVFINNNCEQEECQYIRGRLRERRSELEAAIKKEFSKNK